MNELKESAIKYAKMGLAVFPLIPRDKKPLTANGFKDATTNLDKIEEWWSINPNANIGIATGDVSGGLVAVDMDLDEDEEKDGYRTFSKWVNENVLILPDTWLSITGRGGYHMIFRSSFPVRSRTGWLDAVDIRANGGYIVAPPSVHPNGRKYEWEDAPEDINIADNNDTDVEFLFNSINVEDKKVGEPLKVPDVIPKGHRDETMFKLACKYQAMGMSDDAMYAALMAENQARCNPPLSDKEIRQKVAQALKYQKGESVTIENGSGVPTKKTFKGSKKKEEITEFDLDMPTLEELEERTKNWLINGWIPEGCVTLLCSDGGIGKTSIWCDLVAKMTSGKPTIFEKTGTCDDAYPYEVEGKTVMYFSKEDPTEEVLRAKIRKAGANLKKVRLFSLNDNRIEKIWYGSELLEKLIEKYKPAICVFDTLQAFLPEGVDMAKRKDMREALDPLAQLGAQYGTTFLMVMHTNKSSNSGRQRMADSSDIWDIGRSAIMAGRTKEKNVCYMSHEKCNYGELQKTILFSVNKEGGIDFKGFSRKKDKDYVAESSIAYVNPKMEEAQEFIMDLLSVEKQVEIFELDKTASAAGIAKSTIQEARAILKKEKKIKLITTGYGKEKKWFITLQLKTDPK